MKLELLPSTFEPGGFASQRQHLSCIVVDDLVAIDAGCLAMAATDEHRRTIRNVVLTHAHLDHIAGLPLFVDDLFATLDEPIVVHTLPEVIEVLERDVFNWSVFPRFSELNNGRSVAIAYRPVRFDESFAIGELNFRLFASDHNVPSAGVIVSDRSSNVMITGDTASLSGIRAMADIRPQALLVECAFPDKLAHIAVSSFHMTPSKLKHELEATSVDCPVYVFNIKPNYRDEVVRELAALNLSTLAVMEVGKPHLF